MKFLVMILIMSLLAVFTSTAEIIEVCPDCPLNNLQPAAQLAKPGDTILLHDGVYPGGNFIANLAGTADKYIFIMAVHDGEAIFHGGSSAFQLSDPAFIHFSGLIFEAQTGNGVNIDDGGSYETPAHDVIFENCHWRNMNATGNNDMLKLSGLDSFLIKNCSFSIGSAGGSGIDMVGCHQGVISGNRFEEQGSNCIQAKGGTSDIIIRKNLFRNGGQRSINIGGSTGLQYFRPLDANYEARYIRIHSNIFVGAVAPIAFVGAVDCEAVNNTVFLPDKWAIRILQENTSSGFLPCSNNKFINNIVYLNASSTNPVINIGPNTAPGTFTFANNLWFSSDNPNWNGPNLPVSETSSYINIDPLITPDEADGISISQSSPVGGKGKYMAEPEFDFRGNRFSNPPSVGAIEIDIQSFIKEDKVFAGPKELTIVVAPFPVSGNNAALTIQSNQSYKNLNLSLYSITGGEICNIWSGSLLTGTNLLDISVPSLPAGIYCLNLRSDDNTLSKQCLLLIE